MGREIRYTVTNQRCCTGRDIYYFIIAIIPLDLILSQLASHLDPSFVFYLITVPKAFLILANRDVTILPHLAQFDPHNNIR